MPSFFAVALQAPTIRAVEDLDHPHSLPHNPRPPFCRALCSPLCLSIWLQLCLPLYPAPLTWTSIDNMTLRNYYSRVQVDGFDLTFFLERWRESNYEREQLVATRATRSSSNERPFGGVSPSRARQPATCYHQCGSRTPRRTRRRDRSVVYRRHGHASRRRVIISAVLAHQSYLLRIYPYE
jgi:hypothetical protein